VVATGGRAERVRHHVPPEEPRRRGAERPRRLDVVAAAHAEHLGAHQPGDAHPAGEREHQHRRPAPGPHSAATTSSSTSRGTASSASASAVTAASTAPPHPRGERAGREPERAREQRPEHAHEQRQPRGHERAGQQVAAEPVGA
jgi:hypothetical protein